MENFDIVLSDVIRELTKKEQLSNIKAKLIIDKYFSVIYEICGQKRRQPAFYILKISKTERTCKNEYQQYLYLNERNINSLKPVLFSEKFNYLVTRKENINRYDNYLKKIKKNKLCVKEFFKLGCFIVDPKNETVC